MKGRKTLDIFGNAMSGYYIKSYFTLFFWNNLKGTNRINTFTSTAELLYNNIPLFTYDGKPQSFSDQKNFFFLIACEVICVFTQKKSIK